MNRLFIFIAIIATLCFGCATNAFAQTNSNTPASTTRRRTTTQTKTTTTTTDDQAPAATATPPRRAAANNQTRSAAAVNEDAKAPGPQGVLTAFDALVAGIERADVNAVTSLYWNSPQLILFNNNGTVTKTWEQLRRNRASSYPNLKDVRLAIRDRHVQMLGPTAALITCLWTQSQTFRGTPETASGRMTLVFQRINNAWRIVHLHTSPDAPDPSRVLPSEQTPAADIVAPPSTQAAPAAPVRRRSTAP